MTADARTATENSPTGETEKSGTPAKTPASPCQALAETVVASFVERLKAEARRKGGTLTMEDVEALNTEFEKNTRALQAVFEKSFEEYLRARGPAKRGPARRNAFERLMLQRISHMFADGDALLRDDTVVSRRMVPGFLMAMTMMLGADSVARYREQCSRIMERVRGGHGGDDAWDEVHTDKEANALVLDAQVAIALHCLDPDKRTAWMVDLVNGNLSPPDSALGEVGDVAAWQLTDTACRAVLRALLSDLEEALSTDAGRRALIKDHGKKVCATLAEVMIQLEAEEP